MVLLVGAGQQLAAFAFIGGAGDADVGDAAQEGDVVVARVRGAVCADQARAVQRKDHGQVLQGHVVDELVIRALQEGGVDGDNGFEALAGQPGGQGDGVLLGNAHVEVARGVALVEGDHAGAFLPKIGRASCRERV